MKDFTERVYDVVAAVPKGKVITYGEVARRAGSPKASRAVGNIMNKNPDMKRVPCHRVIRGDRTVGGYALTPGKKVQILTAEGILIEDGKVHELHLM